MNTIDYLSPECTLKSSFVDVNSAKMYYLDEGKGDPIVFLHGIPTSSYLWRNVIPFVSPHARCIALDLIGCGFSDKPDIEYTLADHIAYFEGFIKKLNLSNIVLVLHGWGSVIGFDFAMRHPELIKGLVFLESHIRLISHWEKLSLPVQQLSELINKDTKYEKIENSNFYVEKIFPMGVLRKLGSLEMAHYLKPFPDPKSRRVIIQYLKELPIANHAQADIVKIIGDYSEKLQKSPIPKLMIYAVPGFLTTIDTVQWAKQHLPNIRLVDIGEDLHYAQETKPDIIGDEIAKWLVQL